jgi:MFS family permease
MGTPAGSVAPEPARSVRARLDDVVRPGGGVFFGWWIVLAGGGIQLLSGLLWAHSTGAYMVLLQDEFGWSSTVISAAFALTRVESGLLGPLQGWLTDRFGPRAVLVVGTTLFGVGFMLFSGIDSVLGFFLTFATIAVGASLGGFPTLMVSIVGWFRRHRAKAIAASTMGFALGGLLVPVVVACLETYGWRSTAFGSGIVILVLGLPLCAVVRHRPADWGEVPDGLRRTSAGEEAPSHAPAGPELSVAQALRTPEFWLISVGHALALLIVSAVMLHLVAHLIQLGYSLAAAGLVVSAMTAFQILGQLVGGYLGDRLDKRHICAACMVMHASGLLLVTYAVSVPMVVAFAMLHGLAWGARGPLMVALRADCFGAGAFGTIMGWSSLIVMLGMSGGPIVAGVLADLAGNYRAGFTVLALLSVLGAFCFLAIRLPDSGAPRPAAARP